MACGFVVTLVAAFLLLYPPELLRFFDFRIFDLLLSAQNSPRVDKRIVVVGVDEESLARFGQWPWPRYRLAQLLDRLAEQDVAAIGIDLLMPEEDRTSLDVIVRERQRDLKEGGQLIAAPNLQRSNDQLFADSISRAPVVLGFKFLANTDAVSNPDWLPEPLRGVVVLRDKGVVFPWAEPTGVLSSLDSLMEASRAAAFINAAPDRDGVVRRVPLLLGYRDNFYPSLAFATVLQATGSEQLRFDILEQEAALSWNGHLTPLDQRGNMLIGYSHQPSYRYVSAADLLLGEVPDAELAGAIVFIGAVAAGLGDRHVTPLNRDFPGVAVHAVVAGNLLNGTWFSHPVWARGVELFLVIMLGGLFAWLLSFFSMTVPLLATFGSAVGIAWGAALLFRNGYFLSPTMPVLVLILNAGLLGLARYGVAAKNLRQRSKDLLKAQDATIVSLITLAETRDSDTGAHILRTQRFVKALADQLRKDSKYRAEITDEDVQMMFQSAPLHDIGKVGIPDRILLKTGELTAEEVAVMREHPQLGAMALGCTAEVLEQPENYAYLHYARQMAETHHERWDGSGYPAGLVGEQIPLAGRLMALADVYDALISDRSYKQTKSHEQARDYIIEKSGELFDPEIVRAFLACEDRFAAITQAYRDEMKEVD